MAETDTSMNITGFFFGNIDEKGKLDYDDTDLETKKSIETWTSSGRAQGGPR